MKKRWHIPVLLVLLAVLIIAISRCGGDSRADVTVPPPSSSPVVFHSDTLSPDSVAKRKPAARPKRTIRQRDFRGETISPPEK